VFALVLLLIAGSVAGVVAVGPRRLLDRIRATTTSDEQCTPTVVRVDAAPAITPAVRTVLAAQQGRRLTDDTCLRTDVRGMTPDQAVAALKARGAGSTGSAQGALPDLWIPDATLWVDRVPDSIKMTVEKSLARSPVIITSSTAAVARLGWSAARAPSWAEAVTGVHPVAVDLTTQTCGLATASALRATGKDQTTFRRSLAALSLAVDQGTMIGSQAPLDLVGADSPATPLIPESEQSAIALRRSGLTSLALVYPRDGSPVLDFPLVRVATGSRPAPAEAAVAIVASALRTPMAAETFRAQGFRLPGRAAPTDEGVRQEQIRDLDFPPAAEMSKIVSALASLAAPTRMLALIDVSTSMTVEVAPGVRRIDLVRDAATATLSMLPADNSVGAWVFASRISGDVDYAPLADVARLDAPEGGGTHLDRIRAALTTLPDRIHGGGTSIYDTVDAAVRAMQQTYDGSASNVVVLMTDGVNADRRGMSLDEVVTALESGSGAGAVRLIAIGIGPGVDMAALTRLAEATPAGRAYPATDPEDLQSVLVDALATRG
jgi:Ca-activated chloride channel family protein